MLDNGKLQEASIVTLTPEKPNTGGFKDLIYMGKGTFHESYYVTSKPYKYEWFADSKPSYFTVETIEDSKPSYFTVETIEYDRFKFKPSHFNNPSPTNLHIHLGQHVSTQVYPTHHVLKEKVGKMEKLGKTRKDRKLRHMFQRSYLRG
jgi:hypothetical protein